jgi:hypothetical protein
MKHLKTLFFACIITFSLVSIGRTQDYDTGLGLRVGLYNGLTAKHFLGEKSALEGIISMRWKGIGITGLYELHNSLFNADGLKWYVGGGAHVGFYNGDHTEWGTPETKYRVMGLDGILGLEYSFNSFPISLSIDWKPAFNIVGYRGIWADEFALAMCYTF